MEISSKLEPCFELKGQEIFVFLCGSLRQEGGWEEEGGGDSERVKP